MTNITDIISTLSGNLDMYVGVDQSDEMIETVAREWLGLDLAGWMAAEVFQAVTARELEAAGVTAAEVAALEPWQVGLDESSAPGYAVANGDIRVSAVVAAVEKARE